MANWVLQTTPKFTTGVKYWFYQVFFYQIGDQEIPFTLRPLYIYIISVIILWMILLGQIRNQA